MSDTNLITKHGAFDSLGPEFVPSERKRILLVEGDGFTRLVLLLRLRLAGFGVDFTSNGILGLGKLRSCHPDILLVELKLCGLSGLELIKAARAEPDFGNRPIYVFTHSSRMNRATRKEVDTLATTLLDKSVITREDVVQIFATTFLNREPVEEPPQPNARVELPAAPALSEAVLSGAIEDLIAGVREQSELLASETGTRAETGGELLSRVSSLASCAGDADLPNLARQAKALQNFLNQLCANQQGYTDTALATVTRAVDVMSHLSFNTTGKPRNLTRFSAVFVDESPYSNRAMEEALLNTGFQPACFEDPALARAHLAANHTDLIIANLVLPEAHGLALADIRQLPLHAQTPVLFGPDSIVASPQREELPLRASRLDKALLLLAELVLRSLNQVQSSAISSPGESPVLAKPVAPPTPTCEDSVELFARTPSQIQAPSLDRPSPNVSVTTGANHQAQKFSHLFAAGIPDEPIMRAEPATAGTDAMAESLARLPETSIDGSQFEERPLETLSPSTLQPEDEQPPQPEQTIENHSTTPAWLAAAARDSVPPGNASELDQNEVVATHESASTPNYSDVMNNQLQSAPEDYLPQSELSPLRQASNDPGNQRDNLAARVYAAEMALYHAQAQIDQRDKSIDALQRQLGDPKTAEAQQGLSADAPATPGSNEQKAQARCAELEQEVAALRQAFEGLNGGLGESQQASPDAAKRVEELEQQLNQNAAELEKQKEAQSLAEAGLRRQIEAANAAGQQADARCTQLQQELTALRQANEKKPDPAPASQPAQSGSQTESWAGVPPGELEQQVRQGVASLARATAELAKERGERQRSQQRTSELNGRLQTLHEDLGRTLHAQREDLARITALEEQQHQASQALDRSAADVEQHQAERRLAEEQLQKTKDANAQLRKDLAFFEEANKKSDGGRQELQTRLEASLAATRENEARLHQENAERQRLAQSLEEAQHEIQNQSRRRETIEQELKATHDALQEREAKLHNESAERLRLNQAQDSFQRNLRDGSERDLEFSKIQSALQLEQVERKRQETQLARMRQSALDAAHSARALRTGLRRQIREPVDNLIQSAQSLLELEMGEEQKKLAEAVLQDVLLVQTRLKEPGAAHVDPPEAAAPSATPAT